ncbi:MAG TPA: YkgJ family cysteine cluster protein [Sandaracinaceae bacterium LLY-WYZ-13_1]|nr:YkgJ family cysteine cluster protein [Sandaracinaceae bacterium LLY-WYZ-13_1]
MSRPITHRYEDPLDAIWRRAAALIGLRIERSDACWAATDGRGTLVLGTAETLDPDDCLAQMVFHELCHSLVQGPASFERPDWGLDNESDRDLPREHACLRAQAHLAGRHGLRDVLAPTTDHRAFYDALPADPLCGDAPSVPLARRAVSRARRAPWAPHLEDALRATATIARAVAPDAAAPRGSHSSLSDLPILWARVAPAPAPHPSGLPAHPDPAGRTCGDCAWQRLAGPGKRVPRCRQADGGRVDPRWTACERFEPPLDCLRCGACCREAYQVVEVSARDPFATRHPDLLERADGRLSLRRVDGRCPPLRGDGTEARPFTCALYDERPRTCRDFEREGPHCLDARRRVGLSL